MASAGIEEMYSKKILIGMKCADRDERRAQIQVSLELHTNASLSNKKELVMRLTDDSDLFFLYTLRLTEEDFQSLRAQQGLLVDFSAFPQRLVQLLDMCSQEESKECPKFILELWTSSGSGNAIATLNIIETNPFKHLTHLALKFLPGQDADVKKFLAKCLEHLKDENVGLKDRLARTESDLSTQLRQAREALSSRTMELDALKRDWTSRSKDVSSQHMQELNAEREKSLQTQNSMQQRYDSEKRQLEHDHSQMLSKLESRLNKAESTSKELTERKFQNEASLRELRAKLNTLEEEQERDRHELSSLRHQNSVMDSRLHEQDKLNNQLKLKLAVTEQEVKDKETVMQRTTDLLGTEQNYKKKHEDELDRKKRHVSKLEASIKTLTDELVKGNEIIKKLQGEIKNYHTKNKKLNESLDNTMQKLEESKQLLKTNENVINWLNRQITDSQLTTRSGSASHGPFEMGSSVASSLTNSRQMHFDSTRSSAVTPSPLSTASNTRPHVQFQPRPQSRLPVTKTSPLSLAGTIPEEGTTPIPSPALQPVPMANHSANSEPVLDNKYLSYGEEAPLRKMTSTSKAAEMPAPRSASTTPVPLASTYFPSKSRIT
ncbi:hypothetical protein CAPTEDRAFT_198072 [Capitella teleta]|uniref:Spindle assembly abnormal protein 6 homolog n=1 Tax=Capitella teleta TaxID=283909 RepID=X1ZY97_CAPTE|nr:hypothetical protein CAPTEDRAFT_198072 [Capitella teleta]|eukprot:ELU04624.1 hypothetical protein CAPTEDRAFT_198072 [Capitella teleta]